MSEADYDFQWYSGTGKGGQHRNKHQNCCRCIHRPTGVTAVGTAARSREANKRQALETCMARVAALSHQDLERYRASSERVRTYHAERNEVIDHASGERALYSVAMSSHDIDRLIDARRMAKMTEGQEEPNHG